MTSGPFHVHDSNHNLPAPVDGLPFAGVVFGDRPGGDLLDVGDGQPVHAGLEILVVGGKDDDAPFVHPSDDGIEQDGMVGQDVKRTVQILPGIPAR